MLFLCSSFDEFLEDKCIWVAHLNTGHVIYQDDKRPGRFEPSAWKRLGKVIREVPGIYIKKMQLKFRSHVIDLPSDKECYFYSHGVVKGMNSNGESFFHIVGWTSEKESKMLDLVWYKTPELIPTRNMSRALADCRPYQVIRCFHGKNTQ